jgi:hypothetical protein
MKQSREGAIAIAPRTRLLTRFTILRLLPLNTSPFSTHRFHAQSALWSTMYPTTATQSTGLLSSKLTRRE